MPVAEDLKVLTDTDLVRAYRKSILELTTLNHPVDCGICDKSGECTLQDYHYEHNGAPSMSRDAKVHATKFHKLSPRITLDNERCILCSRCVRFTHEVSKSKSLGMLNGVNLSLVVFGQQAGAAAASVLVFLVFVVAAAEIAIAIPIVLLLARHRRSLDLGTYSELRG